MKFPTFREVMAAEIAKLDQAWAMAEQAEQEARRVAALAAANGRQIDDKTLARWVEDGWTVCPRRPNMACNDPNCGAGAVCRLAAELGLFGDGYPMPRKMRPVCGAKTRADGRCQMRVEPGKRRCRLHGGLSTGPKTAEGKAAIAAATRARWADRLKTIKQNQTEKQSD
jgi:hypothetical protein